MESNLLHQDKWLREAMRLLKKRFPTICDIPPLFATDTRGLVRCFLQNLLPL